MTKGMPLLRVEYIRGPVWAKTPEQLRKVVVEGKSPVSGKPVMQENVVSLFEGWGVLSAKNWEANVWGTVMDFPQIIKDIFYTQDRFFGATAVLSPPIANFVRDAGYDSVEKFSEWLMLPPQGKKPMEANQMNIIVAGGTNNNYYSIGDLRYMQSVLIDKGR